MTIFMDFKRPFVKRHSIISTVVFYFNFLFPCLSYIPHIIFTLSHILLTPFLYITIFFNQ